MDFSNKKQLFTPKRVFYTFSVMFNTFAYGLGNTMIGPSLVDLSYVYKVNDKMINNAPLVIGIGYVVGAFLSGQINKRFENRQIATALFLLPMAVVNFFVLHIHTFWLALCCFFFSGVGFANSDSCLAVWIIELWPQHNRVLLPLCVLFFGIGQMISPLMVAPFVFGHHNSTLNGTSSITREDRIASLSLPFTVCGVVQIVMPILYIVFNFTSFRYESPEKKTDQALAEKQSDPRLTQNPNRKYHLVLAGFGVAAYGGAELGWMSFAAKMFQGFAENYIEAKEASILIGIWSAAFAVGMLLTSIIALKLTPDKIIFGHFAMVFASKWILYFGYLNKPLVYTACILSGYGMSSIWSMKFAFVERHLKLTDQVASTYTVLFGLFAIFVPLILSNTAEQNSRMLLLIISGFLFLSISSFVTLKLWITSTRRTWTKTVLK